MKEVTESHILDSLYPEVERSLSNKSNVNLLKNTIIKYADKWSHILLSANMHERLLFSDHDKHMIFEVCGIDEKDVKKVISQSVIIQSNWKDATNPFYVLSVLILRFFLIHKEKELFGMMALYLAYPMYSSSHFSSFNYLPSKEKMDYTINHLSERFIIKQHGTIQAMVEYTTLTALEGKYLDQLTRCTDADMKDVIYGIKSRIKFNVKYIADKFYEFNKNDKVIFTQSDDSSEEDYHVADNKSFAISKISQAVTRNIIATGMDANTVMRKAVSLNAGVSQKKLTMIVDNLIEKDRNSINKFISDIVTIFVNKNGANEIRFIGSNKFLSDMLQHYKGNSQDELTSRVKAQVIKWIELATDKYGASFISRGKTQIDAYRRAIFTVFIFKIMETVK